MARSIVDIVSEINSKRDKYHELANVLAAPDLQKRSNEIVALQEELKATISEGAKPCEKCGENSKVAGFYKRAPFKGRDGSITLPIFEVGCLNCGVGARGHTPEKAVEEWNSGSFIASE